MASRSSAHAPNRNDARSAPQPSTGTASRWSSTVTDAGAPTGASRTMARTRSGWEAAIDRATPDAQLWVTSVARSMSW